MAKANYFATLPVGKYLYLLLSVLTPTESAVSFHTVLEFILELNIFNCLNETVSGVEFLKTNAVCI